MQFLNEYRIIFEKKKTGDKSTYDRRPEGFYHLFRFEIVSRYDIIYNVSYHRSNNMPSTQSYRE